MLAHACIHLHTQNKDDLSGKNKPTKKTEQTKQPYISLRRVKQEKHRSPTPKQYNHISENQQRIFPFYSLLILITVSFPQLSYMDPLRLSLSRKGLCAQFCSTHTKIGKQISMAPSKDNMQSLESFRIFFNEAL